VTTALRRVDAALDAGRPRTISLLQELVRARAASGNEAAAQALVADRLRAAGGRVDVFDVDAERLSRDPGWGPTGLDYEGRPNVVAVLPGSGGGRSLILNAHIDAVAPGPAELWERDPWSAEIDGDRVYGRGSWDDKAGVATLVWLVEALREADIRLAGDLIVESVIEEEISGNGTLACAERGYRADAAVVIDGRGPGSAVTAHCGQLWFRVAVRGRSAAAVESRRGANAVELLLPLIAPLHRLEAELARAAAAPFDALEHPAQLNIGVVAGGVTPTTVPGLASIDCHLSFPAPVTLEAAKAALAETLAQCDVPATLSFLSLQVPPFTAPESDALLGALDRAQRGVIGSPLEQRTIAGFGDLRHFQRRGDTPCCLYGVTAGAEPHAPNEWVDLAPLPRAARILAAFVCDWCGTAS
jgi:acetylornithine deacetylase